MVPAGRRSGKTELAKRKLITSLLIKKGWSDPRYFAAAPTRDQAKRIFWKDIKSLVPASWVKRVYESDLCIVTKFGSELWVVGLDKPQRIEGTPWDGGVLDEYANMKPTVWTENIRPALSDRGGWCWFIGVPEGLNHYKELADYAREEGGTQWGFYTWHSKDILPAEEIEAARRDLDPRTFRQEYEASFEGATGRVYYAYSSENHRDKSIRLNPGNPIVVCCDFNVDPCVWELCQVDGRRVRVFDEIALRNTNTVEMGKEVLKRYGKHGPGLIVYGDPAGAARSTTGKSDYALLGELGLKDQRVRRSHPAVKDRINAVNSMLKNTKGEVRLTHHPRCSYLKTDFETVVWREGIGEVDKRDIKRTHASDALGYFVEYEFPLRTAGPDPKKKFYK
ncbi:MAG: terminase family protein [Thermodesulfobacteriota bacterium]